LSRYYKSGFSLCVSPDVDVERKRKLGCVIKSDGENTGITISNYCPVSEV